MKCKLFWALLGTTSRRHMVGVLIFTFGTSWKWVVCYKVRDSSLPLEWESGFASESFGLYWRTGNHTPVVQSAAGLNLAFVGRLATPLPGRCPVTHYAGGWVGPSTGLDGCGEKKLPYLHWGSNPGPSSKYPVVTPTSLSWPLKR
jgi:hypothetical protein